MTKRRLRLANHSARRLVGILVMDLLDVTQRGEEDVEELRVEVFPTMFGHEVDGMIEGEGGLVDPLCGGASKASAIAAIRPSTGMASPFNLRGYPLPSQRS